MGNPTLAHYKVIFFNNGLKSDSIELFPFVVLVIVG
jgi:hypothetical protein